MKDGTVYLNKDQLLVALCKTLTAGGTLKDIIDAMGGTWSRGK